MVAGVVMLLGAPFFQAFLPRPLTLGVFIVLVFAFVAGFTSPNHKFVAWINFVVSAVSVIVFELYALYFYATIGSLGNLPFIANQALAILFFFSLYYSVKTARGMILQSDTALSRKGTSRVLRNYGKNPDEIKEIFWDLLAGGANEEMAARIITNNRYLDKYLRMKKGGVDNRTSVRTLKDDFVMAQQS